MCVCGEGGVNDGLKRNSEEITRRTVINPGTSADIKAFCKRGECNVDR